MISNIKVGDEASRAKDVLGRVYEYFLSQFASAEGKKGGEFYTPRCVVKLLVEMLEPHRGRVYVPCCGSSGMLRKLDRMVDRTHRELTAQLQIQLAEGAKLDDQIKKNLIGLGYDI